MKTVTLQELKEKLIEGSRLRLVKDGAAKPDKEKNIIETDDWGIYLGAPESDEIDSFLQFKFGDSYLMDESGFKVVRGSTLIVYRFVTSPI